MSAAGTILEILRVAWGLATRRRKDAKKRAEADVIRSWVVGEDGVAREVDIEEEVKP